jgi:hypothetical protein
MMLEIIDMRVGTEVLFCNMPVPNVLLTLQHNGAQKQLTIAVGELHVGY